MKNFYKQIHYLIFVALIIIVACQPTSSDREEMEPPSPVAKTIIPNYYPDMALELVNFSRNKSWLIIKKIQPDSSHRLFIKTLSGRAISKKWLPFWSSDFFELAMMDGENEVVYETTRFPNRLELKAESGGSAVITFSDPETIYFSVNDVGFRLIPSQGYFWNSRPATDQLLMLPRGSKMFQHFKTDQYTKLELNIHSEKGAHNQEVTSIDAVADGTINFAFRSLIEEKKWAEPLQSITAALADSQQDIDTWMKKMPEVPQHLEATAKTAWYTMHIFQVGERGLITRPTLFCSKNSWLTKIWSWDHCFHGMALATGDLQLGWDQIMVLFDNQLENGALPEPLNDVIGDRGFTKPPIHGWTIKMLINTYGVEANMPYLKEVYEPLSKFTNYWYEFMDINNNGMPNYRHGNDGGWDNATAYDQGMPTEGADLAAYLVIQQEVLANIATLLGKPEEAKSWQRRADEQYAGLMKNCVKDSRFISPLETTGRAEPSQSLVNYMPLMLGNRLPDNIKTQLIEDLRPDGEFLTKWGFASEALNSPKFEEDGYWQGAIWAPPNYQLFYAMLQLGEIEKAREIAKRYTDMINRDPGFWENYSAIDGTGLQAHGVSWTHAVFILLAKWLAENPE